MRYASYGRQIVTIVSINGTIKIGLGRHCIVLNPVGPRDGTSPNLAAPSGPLLC